MASAEIKQNNSEHATYDNKRDILIDNLKQLPPTELHYYFALLVSSIDNEPNSHQHIHLVIRANEVISKLNAFYSDVENNRSPDLTKVTEAINDLIISSKIQSTPHKIKMAILLVCSTITGVIFGVAGAAIGFLGALFSDYTIIGNLRAAPYGFAVGLALGTFIGTRCPYMAFQRSFEQKLEFCIKSIEKVGKELSSKKPHVKYEAETKQYILNVFFKDTPDAEKEVAFKAFLESNQQQYQVSTTSAGFISRRLKGHLGHHNLIAFSINGAQDIPMEYGDRLKTPSFFDQNESPRVVTGQKLFDMLVMDRMLQETYKYTLRGFFADYQIADNDCRTYIDKILIGTKQPPTKMPRFNSTIDKYYGTYIIGPMVRLFSKTKETELRLFFNSYKENINQPDPEITARTWSGKKTGIAEEQQENNAHRENIPNSWI